MKINVEFEVPDGDFCHDCERHVPWRESCTLGCSVFNKRTHSCHKLEECKAAKTKYSLIGLLQEIKDLKAEIQKRKDKESFDNAWDGY